MSAERIKELKTRHAIAEAAANAAYQEADTLRAQAREFELEGDQFDDELVSIENELWELEGRP